MESENSKKTKKSDHPKIFFLRSDFFENAKFSSMIEICYSPFLKCFFLKYEITLYRLEKSVKTILNSDQIL